VSGQPVETKFGVFPEVKENQQLKTEDGRAEVLLTPGVFLRVGENSSFRMITNRLIDTRLEFQSGSAVIEAEDIGKDNSVTVVYKDATVHPAKKGIYRFDAAAGELHVYDGLAEVTAGDQTVEVKDGHVIALDTLAVRRFDKTTTDALNRWSERRAEYVSVANVGAASTLSRSMFGGNGLIGGGMFSGGWFLNPFFGMYSYVPGGMGSGGMMYSPYGCPVFSPFNVSLAYMPSYAFFPCYSGFSGYPGYGGYGGYPNIYNTVAYKSVPVKRPVGGGYHPVSGGGGVGHGVSSGYSGVPASSTSASSSASPSVGASHGGGFSGGGGGGGGSHR
jgi:hypothetical protein